MDSKNLASLFFKYFDIVFADTDALKAHCYKIRYDVYCNELEFEDSNNFPNGLETDNFDQFSHHYLIKHKTSDLFAGTVRIVDTTLSKGHFPCPFELHCLNSITDKSLHPGLVRKKTYCEVSRLAVPNTFRRRKGEEKQAFVFEGDRVSISLEEKKAFPYIAIGLYFCAAAHFVNARVLEHIYVMMEPRLAIHLKRVGIEFKQIGPVTDYHGKRAAYHINRERLLNRMQTHLLGLYTGIETSVVCQLKASYPALLSIPAN